MIARRSRTAAGMVAVLAMLGALLLSTGTAKAATGCPPGGPTGGYPPASCTLTLNVTIVIQGGTITITGAGFGVNVTVIFRLFSNPIDLGTAQADASGTVTKTVTVPADLPTGRHSITATGPDGAGGTRVLTTNFTVVPPAAANGANHAGNNGSAGGVSNSHNNSGGLPFTGAWLAPMGAAGVALIGVGVFFVVTFRRRRGTQATA